MYIFKDVYIRVCLYLGIDVHLQTDTDRCTFINFELGVLSHSLPYELVSNEDTYYRMLGGFLSSHPLVTNLLH